MASTNRQHAMTYEEYYALPDDGLRYQVIEGSLVVNPAPGLPHQFVSFRLALAVGNHVKAARLGRVLAAPTDVVLDEHNVFQPDLLFVRRDRIEMLSDERHVGGAPELVVEILSPRTTRLDRGRKRRQYAAHRVAWMWIVDPTKLVVEEYALAPRGYRLSLRLDFRSDPLAVFRPLVFPGLEIPLSDLFGDD